MTCLRATTLICLYFDCKDSGFLNTQGIKIVFWGVNSIFIV